ncbi:uncharacterized protein LOC142235631 [Haematobia irritans]|uniref:uncharacterized protein LOC142235631 n=1 Tax=Haematobia irritans TaxID=7368 RepID=UPI003F4F7BA8
MVTDGVSREIGRLFIRDNKLDYEFLIDTGADVSVFPASSAEKQLNASALELFAANQSAIKTYGTVQLSLNLGLKRNFSWTFILADVNRPIIGADFLSNYGLLVDVKNNCLIDCSTKSGSKGTSYYGEFHSVKSISESSKFYTLLQQFPNLTQNDGKISSIKHSVKHHIETTGPPLHSKARRLSPEKTKYRET